MIVGVLTTCHTQYTWDSSICIFFYLIEQHSKFLLRTLQVLYMRTLCDSTNINTIIEFVPHKTPSHCCSPPLVNCAPSGVMHNYCTPHIIKESFENFLIHRCNYILLSQVYCVWQVVKTPTIILNNPVFASSETNTAACKRHNPALRQICTRLMNYYFICMFKFVFVTPIESQRDCLNFCII